MKNIEISEVSSLTTFEREICLNGSIGNDAGKILEKKSSKLVQSVTLGREFSSEDLTPLKSFSNLYSLSILPNKLLSLDGLKEFKKLKELKILNPCSNEYCLDEIFSESLEFLTLFKARNRDIETLSRLNSIGKLQLVSPLDGRLSFKNGPHLNFLHISSFFDNALYIDLPAGPLRNMVVSDSKKLVSIECKNGKLVSLMLSGVSRVSQDSLTELISSVSLEKLNLLPMNSSLLQTLKTTFPDLLINGEN